MTHLDHLQLDPIIISHFQIAPLLKARLERKTVAITSLDLGRTTAEVTLESSRVLLPGGESLAWDIVEQVSQDDLACFQVKDGAATKIARFSEYLNRYYSLMPTERAPTLLISGVLMHRVKGITPDRDTLSKLRAIGPLAGRVLDTCTGLGYTAIEAARTAEEVVTIELDPEVLEVARLNPWSRRLFNDPGITQLVGDAYEEIEILPDETFSRIIHDPPRFSLAGDLYSGSFYMQLHRVLKRKGRLFHYVGDPESRSGRNVARGVVRRLREAGYSRIVHKPTAFGLVAYK